MKSVFEELGGTYTLGRDGMFYPNLVVNESDQRPIGRWGRMHKAYLEKDHPELYARLILNGTLQKHLADINRRADTMMEQLTEQKKSSEKRSSIPYKRSNRRHDRSNHACGFWCHPNASTVSEYLHETDV